MCDMRAPATHAIVQFTAMDPDSIEDELNLETPLPENTCAANIDLHVSVHPNLPDQYELELILFVDNERIDPPFKDIQHQSTGSWSYEETVVFKENITGIAAIHNRNLDGGSLLPSDDGSTTIHAPMDAARARLNWVCDDEFHPVEYVDCDIDATLEEELPPSRCP